MNRQRGDDGIAVSPLVVPECSDAERRKVALLVAYHGHDMDDRRNLLRMLGLWEPVAAGQTSAPDDAPQRPVGPVLDVYGQLRECGQGHRLTAANTLWLRREKPRPGWRWVCRECGNARKRKGRQP